MDMMLAFLVVSVFVTAASAVAGSAPQSPAPQSPAPPSPAPVLESGADAWQLVWRDEFDYPDEKLDERWESQNGPSGHILCSRWRENARVEDGTLKLINRKEERGGQQWTSGNLWTREQFQYGYFECRYRYAAAPATNNSFWLMTRKDASQLKSGTDFASTQPARGKFFEIDINEGHYPATVNTNIHNWSDLVEVNGKKRSQSDSRSITFGLRPDRVRQLEQPITTRKLRFASNHARQFHVREFRVFGVKPEGDYPDVFTPAPEAGPTDFARDPDNRISVSGFYDGKLGAGATNEAKNLVDNDPATSWIAQAGGPKWIEIEFPEPRTIGCVQFLNGWQNGSTWTGMVHDYTLQYHDGADWVELASFDLSQSDTNFARDFNVFGLEWSEQELVFYVNGKEIRREPNRFCHSPAPIWLSLAIIAWHGKVTDAIDGTFMEVDYVRVFQRKP